MSLTTQIHCEKCSLKITVKKGQTVTQALLERGWVYGLANDTHYCQKHARYAKN